MELTKLRGGIFTSGLVSVN